MDRPGALNPFAFLFLSILCIIGAGYVEERQFQRTLVTSLWLGVLSFIFLYFYFYSYIYMCVYFLKLMYFSQRNYLPKVYEAQIVYKGLL